MTSTPVAMLKSALKPILNPTPRPKPTLNPTLWPKPTLKPTLWRTCRVLANRNRLRLLGVLFREGELTVSDGADLAGVSLLLASHSFRALGARGLLAARRQSRWVFYRPAADPAVHGAAELLQVIQQTFARRREPAEEIFRQVTAFTHPRRPLLVGALVGDPMTAGQLSRRTGISRFALARHLTKLERRGFVKQEKERWRLACPRGALAATLLQLAREEGQIGLVRD